MDGGAVLRPYDNISKIRIKIYNCDAVFRGGGMTSRLSWLAIVFTSGLVGLYSITELAQSQNLQTQVIGQNLDVKKAEADRLSDQAYSKKRER